MSAVSRWPTRWLVALLAALVGVCASGTATAAPWVVEGETYGYDVQSVARVDGLAEATVAAASSQVGDVREHSASLPAAAQGTSTTPGPAVVATNTAPRVTEPMIRDAMENAPLQTQQGAVSLPKVQSAVDQLAAGSPAPPIKVDGSIIVDGNHRYIAGQIMGEPPAVQPWPGGNPAKVIPWWKQVVDPTDWGG